MGAMLIDLATGERLPITDLVFDRGGAVTEIWTLEGDRDVGHDSDLLGKRYAVEFIDCRRACDVERERERETEVRERHEGSMGK
jgi:hypothetical protein